ncbi:MAG: hypothetical protein HKN39_00380 [Flavobacteriales bacterium]|nr:hypothetical protein [Flavobacteriales bacterium]
MKNYKLVLIVMMAAFLTACDKDDDPEVEEPTTNQSIKPNVGGPEQANQVYLDLGSREMVSSPRNSWDLAFYCGAEFKVILNSSLGALTQATAETMLSEISVADTAGMENVLSLDAVFANMISPTPEPWLPSAFTWADAPSGDLSQTAIAEASDVTSNNMVYILNSGKNSDNSQRPWYKLKVDKSGDAYELQFADFNGGAEQSATINKDNTYNFVYYSFENGIVDVAPARSDWDIAFTTYTDYAFIGFNVPYFYKDFVIQNRAGVEVAEYIIGDEEVLLDEFNNFNIANASLQTFSTNINTIGGNWRTVATPDPTTVTAVKTDRFYIVKDANGTYHKVLFSQMLSELGERGYPEILVETIQ